jgi:hypothetical protein
VARTLGPAARGAALRGGGYEALAAAGAGSAAVAACTVAAIRPDRALVGAAVRRPVTPGREEHLADRLAHGAGNADMAPAIIMVVLAHSASPRRGRGHWHTLALLRSSRSRSSRGPRHGRRWKLRRAARHPQFEQQPLQQASRHHAESATDYSRIHARSYGGRSGGVFGTLRCPHLIPPYLAYYDQLASHYGGPWCSPIPWWCN